MTKAAVTRIISALGALALICAGCRTAAPLAPIDLSAPGWIVRQGQALWQPDDDTPEIAGDVVISTHPSGGSYVQFSKTLPIVSARIAPGGGWEFQAIPENKHYSGGGKPPTRIVWLQLLRALEGREISERWSVAHPSERFIALEDPHTGQRLQVHFQN